jgi:hypothetical protein
MRFRHLCVLLLLMAVAPSLFADGTIRYTSSVTFGPVVAAAAALSKNPINLAPPPPTSRTMKLKNGKMEQDGGVFTGIFDSKNSQVTFVDSTRKLFATTSVAQLVDQLVASMPARPPVPAQAQMFLQSMTMTYASQKTGRTGMTLGLQTEETEITMSLSVPVPPGMQALLANTSAQPGAPVTVLKMVIHMWYPTQSEVARVPALGEFTNFWTDETSLNADVTRLLAATQKLLGKYPGLGSGFAAMTEDTFKNRRVMLKMDVELYAPVMAQLAPMMKAQRMPDFDLSAPVLELHSEAAEVSSAPIDDSVFAVPSDYRATPLADFLKGARAPVNARAGSASGHLGPRTPSVPADAEGLERLPFL